MNVSICIATYGGQDWAEAAWAHAYPSTLGQDAGDVQVVHLADGTLAQARNTAAVLAKGDWLVFLDADDELEPGYIDAMRTHWPPLTRWIVGPTDAPLLAPAVRYVGPRERGDPPAIPNAGRWPDMNECVIGTMIWRKLFDAVGGFRELPSLEDYDLWLRCVKAGSTIEHVPAAVYRATVRPGSRNTNQSVYHRLRLEHADVWERGKDG